MKKTRKGLRLLGILLAVWVTLFAISSQTGALDQSYRAYDMSQKRKVENGNGILDALWALCINDNKQSPGEAGGKPTTGYSKIDNVSINEHNANAQFSVSSDTYQQVKRLLWYYANNQDVAYAVVQNEYYHLIGVKNKDTNWGNGTALQAQKEALRQAINDPSKDAEIDNRMEVIVYKHSGAKQNLITVRIKEEEVTTTTTTTTTTTESSTSSTSSTTASTESSTSSTSLTTASTESTTPSTTSSTTTTPETPKHEILISKTDLGGEEIAGAKIVITKDGKEVASWTSEAGKTRKLVLEAGEYVFHEEVAPKGYLKVTDITFLVNEDGSVTVKTDTTTAHASKTDGNKLTVIDEADVPATTSTTVSTESSTSSTSETSVSTESSTSSTSSTSASTESSTPSTTSSTTTTPETPKHEILISKTDLGGEEIAGAKIVITKDGKEVASWTSEAGKTRKLVLEAGEYVFHEEVAPKGYLKVTDITFLVNEDGSVTVTTDTTTAHASKVDGNKLTVVDEAETTTTTTVSTESTTPSTSATSASTESSTSSTSETSASTESTTPSTTSSTTTTPETPKHEILISKTDLGGEEIAGAKIVVTKDGKEVASWTSEAGKTRKLVLEAGEYVFHEEVAPKGYLKVTDITFLVNEDGSVTVKTDTTTAHSSKTDGNKLAVIDEAEKSMGTTLTGPNGAKEVDLGTIKLTDTIAYKNFPVGDTITFKGELIDKSTGKVVATAESTQTITDSNGTATVVFEFDTRKYAGKDLVAFETAYDASGRIIAEHKDINDKGQTVKVKEEPKRSMGTTLTGLKGAKEVDLGTIKLTDTITYKNFPVGEKITFKGELIDKSTGKVVATAESTQTIADSNGTATVVFEFDTRKYAGKDLVAFETAYDASGRIIAEHKDINDKGQTVKVKEEPNGSTNPPKGSKSGSSGKRTLPSTGTKHIVLLETIGLVVGLGLATVNLRKSRDY